MIQLTEAQRVTFHKMPRYHVVGQFVSGAIVVVCDQLYNDARVIDTREASELSEHDIAHLMVGRDISFERIPASTQFGEPVLCVRDLSYVSDEGILVLNQLSFDVRAGEILGLAGVVGNGQTELIRILTGLMEPSAGVITVKGEVYFHVQWSI